MPDRETPKEPRLDSQRSRSDSPSHFQRSSPHPTTVAAPRGKPVIVVGVAGDIPRALEHPSVAGGQFTVAAVIAVESTDETTGPSDDDLARLEMLMRSEAATTVIMAGPVGPRVMRSVADLAAVHRCNLLAVMPTEVLVEQEPVVVWSGDASFVELISARRRSWAPAIKRGIDIVVAFVALVLALPLIAVAAFAIWLESPGSPLFRHERVGYRGKRFLCLKLRTMRVDAEACLRCDSTMYEEYRRHHFKIPDDRDPRVTGLGRWLRRTSIDELPQLWNVLTGEMSLVGPRPIVSEELELYGRERNILLSVRPGITGAWAVSGRQEVGYPERCEIELRYVRGWRLSNDVRILAKTLVVVTKTAVIPSSAS